MGICIGKGESAQEIDLQLVHRNVNYPPLSMCTEPFFGNSPLEVRSEYV